MSDVSQIVREGTVSAVFAERHTVKVVFEDRDGLTSAELPVLTLCAANNKFYSLPDVGTTVVCLLAGNSAQTGTGFVIGSRFHDKSEPNADSIDKTKLDFSDGTSIEYDRSSHELTIKCEGKITIEAKDDITVKSDKKITFDAKDEIVFSGQKGYTLTATENVILKGEKILLNMES